MVWANLPRPFLVKNAPPGGPKGAQISTKKWKNRRLFRPRVLDGAFFSFLSIFSRFLAKKGAKLNKFYKELLAVTRQ